MTDSYIVTVTIPAERFRGLDACDRPQLVLSAIEAAGGDSHKLTGTPEVNQDGSVTYRAVRFRPFWSEQR